MAADDCLGVSRLEGGPSDALKLCAVIRYETMTEHVVAEAEVFANFLIASLEVGAMYAGFALGVWFEPCLEVGLDVDRAILGGLGYLGRNADHFVFEIYELPYPFVEQCEFTEHTTRELWP